MIAIIVCHTIAFIPESIHALAGLLTYSPLTGLPICPLQKVTIKLAKGYRSLQLRVQFRTHIGFPFHPHIICGTNNASKL